VDAADVDGGAPRPVVGGAGRTVAGLTVAGETATIVLVTPTSFGEIVTVDLATGAESVRTAHGANLSDVELFVREEREFTISDGTVVHGWLIRDPEASGPRPLLLDIHGGPHNAWNGGADEIHLYHQELVARGWAVLLLNPRGSDGYGEAFYNGGLGGWGTADAEDFLEPLDELVADGTADAARLAVTGYSYGGFMTCYLTSRDDRFAAAVAGGVVADLTSLAGTSDAGHFLSQFELGGQPWVDGRSYAAMSPLSMVDKVVTPTLIVHGAADLRCPVGQAEQWHTALRERDVPTRLVLTRTARTCSFSRARRRTDGLQTAQVVDWLEQYAGDRGRPAPGPASTRRTGQRRHDRPRRAARGFRRDAWIRASIGRGDEAGRGRARSAERKAGVTTTTDSVFQFGSISKVWTATIVMQLGTRDCSTRTRHRGRYHATRVPPPTRTWTKQVTMRHLPDPHQRHRRGDVFTDTVAATTAEKYVALLASRRRTTRSGPPGPTATRASRWPVG
jgi:predicted alpha/beta-fold hydrolase